MSFDVFAKYATDETLERNGTWCPLGGGAELLVARSGNRSHAKLLTKEVEKARKVLDLADELADDKSDEIMINVAATTLLLGWKGLSFKGEAIEYSLANAKKLLAVKDFRRVVAGFADDMDRFLIVKETAQGEA